MIQIEVRKENGEQYIKGYHGQNLLELLQKNHILIPNICHRNGTCGKCKVKIIAGNFPITEADRRVLSKEELKQGIRLACKAYIEDMPCQPGEEDILSIEILGKSEEEIVVESILLKEYEGTHKTIPIEENKIEGISVKGKTSENDKISQANDKSMSIQSIQAKKKEEDYFIAIDIGTTTIAMALVKKDTGKVCDTYTSLNHQRRFGADIISRIAAANDGNAKELKRLIEDDLWRGISWLVKAENSKEQNGVNPSAIFQIIISGNTTMIHLLMGYSCQSLGKYPFISEHLSQIECTLKDCIAWNQGNNATKSSSVSGKDNSLMRNCMESGTDNLSKDKECCVPSKTIYKLFENIPVTILPGISAFVGGDIVAGILTCPGFETEENCLLIDLGTNGEMVLGNKDRLFAASTAAGPAFEGGNIICGAASIPGSICRVKIQNQKAVIQTIKNKMPPTGICGTGLVSAIAQLKQNKLMDGQGVLRYPYSDTGYPLWTFEDGRKIAIYQQDIREFQMAKSAIRAGVEILMEEYGCKAREISRVYLAGGFGVNLSEEEAFCTGILPEEFRGKVETIGNGALKGAIQVGIEGRKIVGNKILQKAVQVSVSLAENKYFQEKYLKYLV